MNTFHRSYLEYLGAEEDLLLQGARIFPCIARVEPEAPLSNTYHHLVVSEYRNMLIHSVAPSLLPEYRETAPLRRGEDLLERVDDAFNGVYGGRFYRIRQMIRYTTAITYEPSPLVTVLGEEHRDLILKRMGRRGETVRKAFWKNAMLEPVRQGRLFAVIEDGEEIARSNITLLDHGTANISVWTHPAHRRLGLGKAVVKAAANWCSRSERVPVYLVSSSNEPSKGLVESLGFTLMAREILTVVVRY